MARASTGLTISPKVVLRRKRLLPVRGDVLVEVGQRVKMDQTVARALLPGPLYPLNAASSIGVPPAELKDAIQVKEGDSVQAGQVIAESRSFFGLFSSKALAPIEGTVDVISKTTGQVMFRAPPRSLEVYAYLPGRITEVVPDVGVEIAADVALVQGIFGLGQEVFGLLTVVANRPGELLTPDRVLSEHNGAVLVGGGRVTLEALRQMVDVGVRAVVAASASGADLVELVGETFNPASTGNEAIGLTLVLTEGFGELSMAEHTFNLFTRLNGTQASVNGTTQIRAGVLRPEVISFSLEGAQENSDQDERICKGARVRIVRGEAFGKTGCIRSIPEEPCLIGSGAKALVVEVDLDDKRRAVVPRPNVELISK
ncbi:MAG: hypothetical protein GY847_02660 [Proteobacteria bacterium]|nr:hypothetical protein [Pseudomonadota bacterium]